MNSPSVVVKLIDGVYFPYYSWEVRMQGCATTVNIDKNYFDNLPTDVRKKVLKRQIVAAHQSLISKLVNVE